VIGYYDPWVAGAHGYFFRTLIELMFGAWAGLKCEEIMKGLHKPFDSGILNITTNPNKKGK
jgi:hypothetical protein